VIIGLFNSGVLRVLWSFFDKAIKRRMGEIVFTQEVLISCVLGVSLGFFGKSFFRDSAKPLDVSLGFIAYAAIALGFCVGGMTIALTFPDREFVVKLATLSVKKKEGDALSSLLFVFSWTALVHWLAIVLVLVAVLFHGHDDHGLLEATNLSDQVQIGSLVAVCSYALLQFVITVMTLWQVGVVYIGELTKEAETRAASAPLSDQR
jgi:lysylphosphatidylglycerol synthetase-like protein (DUF2156 family)